MWNLCNLLIHFITGLQEYSFRISFHLGKKYKYFQNNNQTLSIKLCICHG